MNKSKKWGLEYRTQKKFIRDRLEFDYLNKLSEADANWLNAFNLAIGEGNFKPLSDLGVTLSKELRRKINSERFAAEVCSEPENAQARSSSASKVKSTKFKKDLINSLLTDLTGEDFFVAQAEALETCGIILEER